jgi:hypothetical protein
MVAGFAARAVQPGVLMMKVRTQIDRARVAMLTIRYEGMFVHNAASALL